MLTGTTLCKHHDILVCNAKESTTNLGDDMMKLCYSPVEYLLSPVIKETRYKQQAECKQARPGVLAGLC